MDWFYYFGLIVALFALTVSSRPQTFDRRSIMRVRRGAGQSSSQASSSASASSSSGSGSGGGGIYFGENNDFASGIPDPSAFIKFAEDNFGGGAGFGGPGGPQAFAGPSSSGASGIPQGGVHLHNHGPGGPNLLSRFGEGVGDSIHASSSASGPRAAFSSSHTSVDSDGKITYSLKAGKY